MSTEGYLALRRFRQEFPAGATVYEQGAVLPAFFVLLSGRVLFEVVGSPGARAAVGEVLPGGFFGLVGAFSGHPTSAAARTSERTELLAVPVADAAEAFRLVPALAVGIVRQFAQERIAPGAAARSVGEIAGEQHGQAPLQLDASDEEETPPAAAAESSTLDGYNEQWFFRDETQCPVCRNTFAYLRVRASGVRPSTRDSDFRIAYRTVDPSLYAVSVCPHCAYASYLEDFAELDANERRALVASRGERVALLAGAGSLCGERTVEDGVMALRLAYHCAEMRGAGPRRRAGLLHRLAWLERGRGDEAAEQALLRQARDAYVDVYEQDPDIQDASAMRVAYLIGDLTLRLGDPLTARRWLLECVNMKTTDRQEGLLRMARSRLDDAREAQHAERSA